MEIVDPPTTTMRVPAVDLVPITRSGAAGGPATRSSDSRPRSASTGGDRSPVAAEVHRAPLTNRAGITWEDILNVTHRQPSRTLKRRHPKQHSDDTAQVLYEWMFSAEHFDFPYPTDEERRELSGITGLDAKQLLYWLTNARKRVWAPLRRQAGLHVPSTAERMRLQAQQRLDIPDGGLLFSSPPPPAAGGLMGPGSAAAYTHLPLHAAPAAAASFGSPVIPPRFVGGGGYPHGGPTVYTHMTPTGAMMSPPSPWAATAPDAWMSLAMRPRLGVPPHAYGPPSIPLPLSAQSPMAHPQGYAGLRPGPIATGQWPAAAPVGMAGHVFHQQLHMQQQQQHLAHLQQQQQLQVQMIAQHQQQQMQMQQMQMLQQGGFPSRELPASHSGGAFSAPPMSSAFVAASTPLAAAAFMTPSSAGGIGAPFPTASGPWIGASRLGSPVVTASGSLVVSTGAPMVAWPAIASRGTIGTPVMPVSTQSYADTSTPSRVTPATSTPSVSEGSAVDVLAAMAAAAAAATSTSMTRSPPRVYSEASMTPISTVRSTESSLATAGTDMAGAGATPSMRTSNQSPSTSSAGRSEAVSVAGPSAMTAYVPASAQINAPAPTPAVVM